ncbi:MAG: type VI secretion system baseplate subunit TssG [Methylococcaceae bacterium]|jgi:type VI secretion system protein ImpH
MHAAQRRTELSVIQRLLDEPYRFQFFQAIRLLEIWFKQNGVSIDTAVEDLIRFQNRTALSFPASEIEELGLYPPSLKKTVQELTTALQKDELGHISITPTFMGFLGSNGTLPAHYTERIAEHELYERDPGPKAFLDTFSNRAVALFYQAWRKYRLEFKYALDGKDQFLPLLQALAGIGHKKLQDRLIEQQTGVLDQTLGFYAAAFRQRPASAQYMAAVLSEYFALPIAIEQFIGYWYQVPSSQQTIIGANNATLGGAALLGARVWQRNLRMRVVIGPLLRGDFESFLPGGLSSRSLEKMLTMFTNLCFEYEIQLVLAKQEVQGVTLTSAGSTGKLGWDTFLMTAEVDDDRADVCYEVHAI